MAYSTAEIGDILRKRGISEHVINDEAGYLAEHYAGSDDIDAVIEGAIPSYMQRTLSGGDRTQGGYDTRDDDETAGGQGGSGSGSGSNLAPGNGRSGIPLDGGAEATQRMLGELMSAFEATNSGQGFDLPDPAPLPTFEVPGENLSPDIDATLLTLMRGENTPMADEIRQLVSRTLSPSPLEGEITAKLSSLLDTGGEVNEGRLTKRILNARERMEGAATGALESLRAQLGDRGLSSLPGAPQGMETGGTSRVYRRVAEPFAQEVGDAIVRESELADARELQAVQLATGWDEARTRNVIDSLAAVAGWSANQSALMLQAANSATDRQEMLSQVALSTLDRNIYWNKFLAEFGLERERVQAEIRQGNQQQLQMMLQMFLGWANGVRGGFV